MLKPRPYDEVILVDECDTALGVAAKEPAHSGGGQLHRAFSILIYNRAGEMLLQRRAREKYHFAGLWTNACCSHPQLGETLNASARRRLQEEFGFDVELAELFTFIYRAHDYASGLTEHELDHVLRGEFNDTPHPDPAEISDWKWIQPAALLLDLSENPGRYTPWFRELMGRLPIDDTVLTLEG